MSAEFERDVRKFARYAVIIVCGIVLGWIVLSGINDDKKVQQEAMRTLVDSNKQQVQDAKAIKQMKRDIELQNAIQKNHRQPQQ